MTSDEQAATSQESFLVADCGSINTSVALFDVAAGSYRLIARASVASTWAPPHSDISIGVLQAIRRISEVTGRELLSERGMLLRPSRPSGSGVDRFAAVTSAASPLATLLVGMSDDISVASGRKALRRGYASEVATFTPADGRVEQQQVDLFLRSQPDLIFIVGGTDGGAEERLTNMVDTISLGVDTLLESKRTHVLYAGNIRLREWVRHTLGDRVSVQVTNNVRPRLSIEQVDEAAAAINGLYETTMISAVPGIQKIQEWGGHPPGATSLAFNTVVQYFAALNQTSVLGLDLGSSSTTVAFAGTETREMAVLTHLGMGQPAGALLDRIAPNQIGRWLPGKVDELDIRSYVLNKGLHPQTVPAVEGDLHLEQALAREVLSCAIADAKASWGWNSGGLPDFGFLLARGSTLTEAPHAVQTALLLLDAIQPVGILSLALDKQGVLPALGAMAAHDPVAVVQALEGGVLMHLGWAIGLMGRGKAGQKALTVAIESERVNRLEIEVEFGSVEVVPLAAGESAEVTLQPARRFDIGFGPGKGKKVTLRGGAVGIIVDARGRPLLLPEDDEARREKVRQWRWGVGG